MTKFLPIKKDAAQKIEKEINNNNPCIIWKCWLCKVLKICSFDSKIGVLPFNLSTCHECKKYICGNCSSIIFRDSQFGSECFCKKCIYIAKGKYIYSFK